MAEPERGGAVLTRAYTLVLLLTLLGFTLEHILRPVIPLLVLDRGGNEVLVGAIAAVHSVPSILFRPTIGRLIDRWRQGLLLRMGTILGMVAPIGLLLPGLAALVPVRFAQGTGWAMYSVSTHALMARRSPAARRGEAAGYYMAMPALANLIGPAIGVSLYLATGEIGPALVAASLGLVATMMALRMRLETPPAPSARTVAERRAPLVERLVEPSALPATIMVAAFMLPQSLFTVFAPVYALEVGAPREWLTPFYLSYGVVLFLSQLVAGRASDRYGRHAAVLAGSGCGAVGLVLALVGGGMLTFAIGAGIYALGVSLVSPTMSALTIDHAPPDRLGAAMATYSVGYQVSSGMGSLLWGGLLELGGFPAAFVVAIGCQLATMVISSRASNARRSVDAR